MKCKLCGQHIKVKTTIFNFFNKSYKVTCNNCFNENMNYYPYFVMPIKGGLLHIFEILNHDIEDYELFIDKIGAYYNYFLKSKLKLEVIYVDNLDEKFVKILDQLSVGNMILLTNRVKEAVYEI